MKDFLVKIRKFNEMYKLELPERPQLNELFDHDISRFKSIIMEEVQEANDIIMTDKSDKLDILTDIADWLGDIIVYCHTKAAAYGLPMEQVLDVIMESNFSKLDADGNPIYDERGKVMKGPGYWKPEPKIKLLLEKNMQKSSNN